MECKVKDHYPPVRFGGRARSRSLWAASAFLASFPRFHVHNRFMSTYVGFDPGGLDRFGWAVVKGDSFPLDLVGHGIADHAQGAFTAATDCTASGKINAVGIDAPLFWIRDGDRHADLTVRAAIRQQGCPTASGTVQHVNSLRGACLIQGILVAMICQQEIAKEIPITESHPKALLWLLGKGTAARRQDNEALTDLNELSDLIKVEGSGVQAFSQHERDAVLGAVAAFAMDSRLMGWQDLYSLETNTITPLDPPPAYWMPL